MMSPAVSWVRSSAELLARVGIGGKGGIASAQIIVTTPRLLVGRCVQLRLRDADKQVVGHCRALETKNQKGFLAGDPVLPGLREASLD